jgi:PAS domain S-box-containing protein
MADPVRILHLEDNEDDSELVRLTLTREGIPCEIIRVDTRVEFMKVLEEGNIGVIISDYTLPSFDGALALAIARQNYPDVPYIFFSGTIGEEAAVESVTKGATDYVLKNRLFRLVPAVKRALREAEEQKKRRLAEEEIIRQKTYFQQLFENAPVGIVMLDEENIVLQVNRSFERIFQYSASEAGGRSINELIVPGGSRRQAHEVNIQTAGEVTSPAELVRMRKDGSLVNVSHHTVPLIINHHPVGTYAMYEDITERKQLEQQFLRAQRMESIGTLAGGIAHDLNNVLSPIMMGMEMLRRKFTDNDSQRILETLEKSARRGSDMVRQVLAFGRGVEGERVLLQPKHLMEEIAKIMQETFPKSVDVWMNVPNTLWLLSADPTQLHQVLLNLCVNARDAMPDGGTLSLSAENLHLDDQSARMHIEAKVGPYVGITVKDTGIGIPRSIVDKIFEPFFTTKEVGKGTGLGLSTVITIVKSHGGFVNVTSEPGKGTTFNIYLPAVTSPGPELQRESKLELPVGRGETILVVDDEASIREITKETLEVYGYQAITAEDGAEAVALFAQHQDVIDAVITDMMMPSMDGPAAIRALRVMSPCVKIIATSGFAENARISEIDEAGTVRFLQKPYTAEKLLTALADLLRA